MHEGVVTLLAGAGIDLRQSDSRGYRPRLSLPGFDAKILKPQNVVEMLHSGTRDVGFAGADWVRELEADLVEVLDTGLDTVRLVAADPETILTPDGQLPTRPADRPLVIASEYERITTEWIARNNLTATFVRSYGATEVFPPEDADCIVDNTATGETLRANGLAIVDEVMRSSTRLYAGRRAMEDAGKRRAIEDLASILDSVIQARRRVMLELNVPTDKLDAVVEALPCMRQPTVSTLSGDQGFAVKAAVPRSELPVLLPALKARGGSDIVISPIAQVLP
jgi:ATP phosphoribosyltransferase